MKQNFVIVALILAIVLLVCGYCEKKGQLTYLEKQFSKFELKKQDFKIIRFFMPIVAVLYLFDKHR